MRRTTAPMSCLAPTLSDLEHTFADKYMRQDGLGWGPQLRRRFAYFTPDDYYEALVDKLVRPGCRWADIGCGRDLFPANPRLAGRLAERASRVFGIDPDPGVLANPFLTDRYHGRLEDCPTELGFDVVTLRMVAEHIKTPDQAVARLARLTPPGGVVVVYTPYRWSIASLAGQLIPTRWHPSVKRILRQPEAPTAGPAYYRLNTRRDLGRHFGRHGFQELLLKKIDDCRVTGAYKALNQVELSLQTLCRRLHLAYPESCLIGVYRRL